MLPCIIIVIVTIQIPLVDWSLMFLFSFNHGDEVSVEGVEGVRRVQELEGGVARLFCLQTQDQSINQLVKMIIDQ